MMYYIGDGYSVAKIPKSYSCSIAAAMAKAHYPEIYKQLQLTPALCRAVVPQSETPQGTFYVVLREPVERFISTCAMFGLTIEDGLESEDEHFAPQNEFVTKVATICTSLDELQSHTGIKFPVVNVGLNKKSIPTDNQLAKIQERYKKDIALYKGAS